MELTEEQSSIVQAIGSAKLLVTAGPGTGKTHVLIHRLAELVGEQYLAPSELLVLSFSRAAVKEIRDRLRVIGGDAQYVRAMTFDSFATRLLALAEPSNTWQTESYEERVGHATSLVLRNDEAMLEATSYKHIVVDEIQDLVGDRAELVKMLLLACAGGFSLFGDPAQGIYGFQVEGEERIVGSKALYSWVRETFRSELTERNLGTNFRAKTEEARVALWAWSELNTANPDCENIQYRLRSDVMRLRSAGSLSLALPIFQNDDASTAILCRNNAQSLVLSGQLHDLGVMHRLQGRASDRRITPWIAIALRDIDCTAISKGLFLELMECKVAIGVPSPIEMWERLKQIERHHFPNRLDLNLVNDRLRSGQVPDELSETPRAKVVVSTIHRAKGLEFQRVFLVDPSLSSDDPAERAEETRLLFVALTRTQSENWHLNAPNTTFFRVREDLDSRWIKGGPKSWWRSGIEVRGDDVDKSEPPGMFVIRAHPRVLQDYLRDNVKLGDAVVLSRREEFIDGELRMFYVIEHDGNPVGVTSALFGGILFRALRANSGWNVNWPIRINGLHVEGVDTVAGLPSSSLRADLGVCGVWLRLRVSGLGTFEYEERGS